MESKRNHPERKYYLASCRSRAKEMRIRRQFETEEQRRKRLELQRIRTAARRSAETIEERAKRLELMRVAIARKRKRQQYQEKMLHHKESSVNNKTDNRLQSIASDYFTLFNKSLMEVLELHRAKQNAQKISELNWQDDLSSIVNYYQNIMFDLVLQQHRNLIKYENNMVSQE